MDRSETKIECCWGNDVCLQKVGNIDANEFLTLSPIVVRKSCPTSKKVRTSSPSKRRRHGGRSTDDFTPNKPSKLTKSSHVLRNLTHAPTEVVIEGEDLKRTDERAYHIISAEDINDKAFLSWPRKEKRESVSTSKKIPTSSPSKRWRHGRHSTDDFPPENPSKLIKSSVDLRKPTQASTKYEDGDEDVKQISDNVKRKKKISFSHQSNLNWIIEKLTTALPPLPMTKLKKLKMRNCGVNAYFLREVSEKIGQWKIETLDLSCNMNLPLDVVEELRDKHECTTLDLSNNELEKKEIKTLGDMKQLKGLRLNYNSFKHRSIATALKNLINNGLEELSLVSSTLTNKQLDRISRGLAENVSLRVLDISHVSLNKRGVNAVARIVSKTRGMERLALSNCALSEGLLRSFQRNVKGKIMELDLSSNQLLSAGNIELVSSLADKVGCEVVDLSSITLDGVQIRQLKENPPKLIQKLSLSENLSINPVEVGKLAATWQLSSLDVSECRLTSDQILELASAIGKHKLRCIVISDPMATPNQERKDALDALRRKTDVLMPHL